MFLLKNLTNLFGVDKILSLPTFLKSRKSKVEGTCSGEGHLASFVYSKRGIWEHDTGQERMFCHMEVLT